MVLGNFGLALDTINAVNPGRTGNFVGSDRCLLAPLLSPLISTTVFGELLDNLCMHKGQLVELQLANRVECGVYRFDWKQYPQTRPGVESNGRQEQREGSVRDDLRELGRHEIRRQCAKEVSAHCPVWLGIW